MLDKKKEAGNLLPITVTEGVTVNILPSSNHEFLMTTKEVANGYGVTPYAILKNKLSLATELIDGKHFVLAITISNSQLPSQLRCAHNAILWTKRGIIRLGFTMRSERSKLFRDWAEELVLEKLQPSNPDKSQPPAMVMGKTYRNGYNRLTPQRLLSIMGDVCLIDDRNLRLSISNKLMNGGAL